MKSTLLIIAVLFTMSATAQDTTYFHRGANLYMRTTTLVNNDSTYRKHLAVPKSKRRRREDRIFTIGAVVQVVALTLWYFKVF